MTSSIAQPALDLQELLSLLRGRQSEWRQRYQLQRIGLFGSTVRNQATANSEWMSGWNLTRSHPSRRCTSKKSWSSCCSALLT